MFVIFEDKVTTSPAVASVGVGAPATRSGSEDWLTVILVQGPQLLFSFNSFMAPESTGDFLSAQART